MTLDGLHILLTYRCTYECDHCFVWGSPSQRGTMTLDGVRRILRQGKKLGTVEWIYFEGGEPFLYYALLRRAVEMASEAGFRVGIVTNVYWATSEEDAREALLPFAGRVDDLSLSRDAYHGDAGNAVQADTVLRAAKKLGIPCDVISIAGCDARAPAAQGVIPAGESAVRFRGRAAYTLAPAAKKHPWRRFNTCPYEDLREPGRVHIDPLGHVHICQGISIGNVFETSLKSICRQYDPDTHPVAGPLLRGGPAQLVRDYGLPHAERYADACHLCEGARRALRRHLPRALAPDSMYGVPEPIKGTI